MFLFFGNDLGVQGLIYIFYCRPKLIILDSSYYYCYYYYHHYLQFIVSLLR